MFSTFKKGLQDRFTALIKDQTVLYVTETDKDLMWETYLSSFPEDERQEHNCNSCRQFIKTYGSIVSIVENKVQTMWDFNPKGSFAAVIFQLDHIVRKAPVKDIFVTDTTKLGTDSNVEKQEDNTIVTWQHLFFQLPKTFVKNSLSISDDTLKAKARDAKQVLKRALDELTLDATETVLELIQQGSIYRGDEHKFVLGEFLKLQKEYQKIKGLQEKHNYCWVKAQSINGAVSGIRNTSIGALLIKISEGVDLDAAVTFFERSVMAPSNYKRPTAIVTKKQVEQAEKTIAELGLEESLGRRFAIPSDIKVNNLLYVNRDTKKVSSILGDLKENVAINPKTLAKVEEVTIDKFLDTILPTATSVEVLLENQHQGNMMSLIAPSVPDAPSLFKWPNGFSWSYNNAVADSMKERVKAAGGKVEGYLRISLSWNNYDDLDLHVIEPGKHEIYYGNRGSISPCGGSLDVDMNAGGGTTRTPVENVIYLQNSRMLKGKYVVKVNNFSRRENIDSIYEIEVEVDGVVHTFSGNNPRSKDTDTVCEVVYDNATKTVEVVSNGKVSTAINSKDVWGIKTNTFHKVSMIMKSPNFWDGLQTGNQHTFFIVEGAHNDSTVRGFFNEFLKPELDVHKRVFETLASKMKVEPADKQVSGLGFSSTTKGELLVRIGGKFSRILRLKFG